MAPLVEALNQPGGNQRWVAAMEIAGPGFVNFRLRDAARQAVVAECAARRRRLLAALRPTAGPLVEFVSANPTGPLHTGHTRQACLGDAICNLLDWQGWQVTREFYYNDAGVQIATLATARCRRA